MPSSVGGGGHWLGGRGRPQAGQQAVSLDLCSVLVPAVSQPVASLPGHPCFQFKAPGPILVILSATWVLETHQGLWFAGCHLPLAFWGWL